MKKILFMSFFMTLNLCVFAQNNLNAVIRNSENKDPLIGVTASIKGTSLAATSNENGQIIIVNVPDGVQEIHFSYVGFNERIDTLEFPLKDTSVIEILLKESSEELEEVVISSTRSTRSIQNIPTRIEFIGSEELGEKGNMKPGDIRMLLAESTGIHVQTTSPTSANASIRIQGLDGRYTQILKDGFPIFSGASSGLGLLQIPPLDLKQVEVIKGSTSTLYGGGAIAGLVNLISKTPTEERDLRFHLNGTSGGGLDINGFYGQKFKKIGTTIFASHNRNGAYDPAKIGFSAIPKFERFVLNPKLFVYFNDKTKMNFGVNTTIENRLGGDMLYIKGKGDNTHQYFEKNKTQRYSTQFVFDHLIDEKSSFQIKNSVSYFNRNTTIPNYQFEGTQTATFTEANYTNSTEKSEWVAGVNIWTDNFKEKQITAFPLRDYSQNTFGAFVQNSFKATDWLQLEAGLRTDYVIDYGAVFLPRVSALFKIANGLTSRIGGGFGYKTPTIFTEESERLQYQNVMPIDNKINKLEKSYGANADINYRTYIGEDWSFSINQLFFYTYLDNPLLLENPSANLYQFVNSPGYIHTKGTETNIKIGYDDLKLFLGYTYTDARLNQNGMTVESPLTPKHRINSILMYEIEDKWKVGLEAYYFSPQKLNNGTTGKGYFITGFMAEKIWERFSLYINFENFLDTRQTRFGSIYTGTITNPVFKDIYAPLDGFVINGGIKFKL
ncbi:MULTISPECIES: TonB-dependent receptor [Bacteroidota]|jgi:iron complex outermembrane receptor protein|uniref:TonB-dependent receptor n=2 Tax=Flavobacterium TaxID=237 RepID=A0A4R5CNC0_9FLAO|nr:MULTISPECIES: TonB-dependent receptor [Bacteroidota]OUD37756.1 collagen-binding protein [Flavobacterium sp. FPG59]TDD74372.1 TonB-dependent receptor [Flavobacterium caseinilyticum]TDD99052.1 TonB-dependent receptor [Flavobacterium sandaracinum]SJN49000.1 TonB-dependent receptor; Outer membrane receptor for ferrienterochelin and colicins [Sphingobacterium sp. JB170]